ncbi:MAG: GAF domain-containing protein [Dehalococcoidales bacterium]|nr:MAG: GAF domain-containing protein [Dehalococcoidales bacterium]
MLALSNKPQQLIEMVLDELLNLLKVDYGWVQLVDSEDHNLRLVASRGSTTEMTQLAGWADSHANLGEQVVVGSKVVVPDLSRNGTDGLASFVLAGFCSLVAVPIRTYHTQGVIGVASNTRNYLNVETGKLLMTIASMVGATINVVELSEIASDREKQRLMERYLQAEPGIDKDGSWSVLTTGQGLPMAEGNSTEYPHDAGIKGPKTREDNAGDGRTFGDHSRRMDSFRRTHRKG